MVSGFNCQGLRAEGSGLRVSCLGLGLFIRFRGRGVGVSFEEC